MKCLPTPHAARAMTPATRLAVAAADPDKAIARFGVQTYFKGRPALFYCQIANPDGSRSRATAATVEDAWAIASTEIVGVIG